MLSIVKSFHLVLIQNKQRTTSPQDGANCMKQFSIIYVFNVGSFGVQFENKYERDTYLFPVSYGFVSIIHVYIVYVVCCLQYPPVMKIFFFILATECHTLYMPLLYLIPIYIFTFLCSVEYV